LEHPRRFETGRMLEAGTDAEADEDEDARSWCGIVLVLFWRHIRGTIEK
jgi:hypothetical protein